MGDNKCLRETKGRRHPTVDPKVISKLRKFFVEHNQRFYELIGEDLGELILFSDLLTECQAVLLTWNP
jgi:hypothetical protein